MQKSINTQRLERNEVLGRGVGAGLGALLAGYSPRLLTETMGRLPYLRQVAARVVTTSSLTWTTFLVGSIPNAIRTLAYNAAEDYLESAYPEKVLNDSPLFRNVVLYGTSFLSLGISVVLIGKITGIAMITVLGYSTVGWIANKVIGIACALLLSFDDRQKELSKKLETLTVKPIKLERLSEKSIDHLKKIDPELAEQFPPSYLMPIDLELWNNTAGLIALVISEIAKAIDWAFTNTIGAASAAVDKPKEITTPNLPIEPKKENKPSCPCENYKKREPKNLAELSKTPSMEKVENKEVKGIPNPSTACYQNSSMQVLFNLIDTVGEDHFEFYQIFNDPQGYRKKQLQKRLDVLKGEWETAQKTSSEKNEKTTPLETTIKYLTSLIEQIEQIEKKANLTKDEEKPPQLPLKDNPVLVTYLKEFVKPTLISKVSVQIGDSQVQANTPIDGEKLKKLVDGHLDLLQLFLRMREEYKSEDGVKIDTVKSFRKAMYDLYLYVEKDGVEAQRDPEQLLNPLLNVLGVPPMPFQEALTYEIDQDKLKEAKRRIEEQSNKIPKIENNAYLPLNDSDKPPLEVEQKYEFEKNVENHPCDLVIGKNNLPVQLAKIDDIVESEETKIHLSSLVVQAKVEERENFQRGDLVISQFKNIEEERNLPLQFPDWYDREKEGRPFFSRTKEEPLQVIKATRSKRLIKGDPIPPFTIINLTRAIACNKHKQKNHTRVIPDETLELEVFDPEQKTTTKIIQELNGACVHFGGTEGGHWISYTRKGNDWFYCSDKTTGKVTNKQQMFNQMSVNGTVFTYVTKKTN